MLKLFLLAFLTYWNVLVAFKYEIQFHDENLFRQCDDFPDYFLDKFITLPENITILPDDNLFIEGDIMIVYDMDPSKQYQFQIEFFKRERGDWQKTVYTIKRRDFCTSLFDPSEIWHTYIKHLPAEFRKCPLVKGQIFSLKLETEQDFEFSSPSLEGEYRAHFEMGDKKDLNETFACIEVHFNVFRV